MFKLALNAGHGLNTAGKRCLKSIDPNETREWVLNSRICEKLQELLSGYEDISIIRTDDTTGKTDIPISQRTKKANDFKADLYLSIHHNAGIKGGTGGGIETYTYTYSSEQANEWQKVFYTTLVEVTGLKGNRSNGIKKANFAECRETDMPAVLCENGYMDSVVDTPIILTDTFAQSSAQAYCNAIVNTLGLSPKKIPSAAYDLDTLAKQVIEGLWGNGEERKQRLTEKGYSYKEIQARVNQLISGKKSNDQIANEVIKGLWGNGEERRQRLEKAGYSYTAIQKLVNIKIKGV